MSRLRVTVQGLLVDKDPELKKKLTVRPSCPMDEFKQASFKVFKENSVSKKMVVPRYYPFAEGERIVLDDTRPAPSSANIQFKGSIKPELHQDKAVDKFFTDTPSGGVLCLDVGFGKTVCALAIAARVGLRTMILVHKEFLMNQWIDRIKTFCPGSSIGIVQQDKCELDCDFVIAMIHTLSQKPFEPGKFSSVGLLIVDEAHHIGARVFSQSMFKLCPMWTLGLTATPDRKDELGFLLNWFLGPTYFVAKRTLQKNVRVRFVEFDHGVFGQVPMNRFGKANLPELVTNLTDNPQRNALLLSTLRSLEKTRNVLVLSDRRTHCQWLCETLGSESGLYMGGMSQEELRQSEQKRIIVATFSQAHEGLDIPKLDTVVLATPHSDVRQAIGRILRETPGKKHGPLIIDFFDRLGPLTNMYYKRRAIYKAQGFTFASEENDDECLFSSGDDD